MGYCHPLMLVDPHGNHNNHDAVLIDRDNYSAQAKLLALENSVLAEIRAVAKTAKDGANQ